jgi:hypothetical protein
MVAIDDMVMQQTSLQGNIPMLQRICVGGNRGHMQRIKFVAIIHIAIKINGCL